MPADTFAPAANRDFLTGQIQIWVASLLIATSFPVGAAIASGLDPAVLTLLRFVMAVVLFAPIIVWRYGLSWPGWRALAGYAGISLCMTGFFWAMFEALRYTTALNTGTLFVLIPSFAALYSFVLLGARLSRYQLIALVLGIVGALWVIFRGDLDRLLALDLNRGDAIFFVGILFMGAYAPMVKKMHRSEPPAVITFWSLTTGCVWLLLFTNTKLWTTDWGAIDLGVFGGIAYLAVFTTILSTFFFQAATLKIGPNRVAAYTYVNPLLVVLLDWAIGLGLPPLRVLPGVLITLAATFVLQQAARRQTPAPPPR